MTFDFRYKCGTDSVIGIFLYLSVKMGRRTKIRKWLRKISRTILQITIKDSEIESLRIRYIFDLDWPRFTCIWPQLTSILAPIFDLNLTPIDLDLTSIDLDLTSIWPRLSSIRPQFDLDWPRFLVKKLDPDWPRFDLDWSRFYPDLTPIWPHF